MERSKINLNESATTVIAVGSVEDEGSFGDFTDTVTCDCVCLVIVLEIRAQKWFLKC